MSTSTEYMDGLNAPAERRFYPRVTPPTPIYVAFGSNNLGVLCDVSENGFQVSTPDELLLNSVFRVSLSLNGTPKTIVVAVRTVWTNDAAKRSGIQLLDLSDEDRQHIRKWIVFELNRSENQTAFNLPKNGERPSLSRKPMDANLVDRTAATPQPNLSAEPQPQLSTARSAEWEVSPAAASRPDLWDELPSATIASQVPTRNAEPEPVAEAFFPRASDDAHTPAPPPVESQPAAASEADLPKIANPFDQPDPSDQFTSPFPKVPLPIHGEFEYATPPPKIRRRKTWSSQLRTRPLIVWAAALALLCFGANALVRYKIKRNAQRFASESASTTPAKQSDSGSGSSDNSDSNSTNAPVTDSPSANSSGADTASKDQLSSTANGPVTAAQNDRQFVAAPAPSRSSAKNSDAAQPAPRPQSSLDAADNRAYVATAPPSSDRSEQLARSSQQPTPTPRTWSAPAPSASSATASPSDAPQSPTVSASNGIPAQSAPAPVAAQTQPVPPPSSVQAPSANNSSSSVSASNAPVNNPPARTQTAPSSNQQASTYAANPAPSRPQSPIYNANAPAQRSAIMSSINSVHSSGIFDSNDTTTASSNAPPTASRGNANAANANVARPVSNATVVSSDVPQDRDIEIPAPKGFNSSWVDLPGEHLVRSPAGTVHIHRLVRVPGERVPGQRWLWRGKFNVTLGEVINRIDPSVLQASGASGSLTVMASIDKDGYVTDLKPLYGNFALLPSVSRTVRNWHYEPTYLDNKRAETQAQIEFDLRPTTATSSTNRTTRP